MSRWISGVEELIGVAVRPNALNACRDCSEDVVGTTRNVDDVFFGNAEHGSGDIVYGGVWFVVACHFG